MKIYVYMTGNKNEEYYFIEFLFAVFWGFFVSDLNFDDKLKKKF